MKIYEVQAQVLMFTFTTFLPRDGCLMACRFFSSSFGLGNLGEYGCISALIFPVILLFAMQLNRWGKNVSGLFFELRALGLFGLFSGFFLIQWLIIRE